MKKILPTVIALSITGCSTIFNGSTDDVNLRALGTDDRTTECIIKSNGAEYFANGRVDSVSVDRDSDDLFIRCNNETQEGIETVEPEFMGGYLFLDILWDACILTLSCPIDLATGNFYDYPDNISVEMKNKDGSENSLLLAHKEEEAIRIEKEKAEKKQKSEQNRNRSRGH
ncbi:MULTISPECIES: hypothetical protein [Vibrio]|uniref:Lipoprotein n=1 Tax=Vibrio genomosp. F6 str. FF-238 TaxID=1191298 RepID=A0A1E5CXY6_9VIBR|nr:hypothetical protein [Vibrio genomosp. F6]OEE75013.1 hypothetical protein A130_17505 [Vibrio genomosp. F6 str. FF-238]